MLECVRKEGLFDEGHCRQPFPERVRLPALVTPNLPDTDLLPLISLLWKESGRVSTRASRLGSFFSGTDNSGRLRDFNLRESLKNTADSIKSPAISTAEPS